MENNLNELMRQNDREISRLIKQMDKNIHAGYFVKGVDISDIVSPCLTPTQIPKTKNKKSH